MEKGKKQIPYDKRPYRNPGESDPYCDWPEEWRSTANQLPEDWMSTAEDQLRFVIRFCQLDLDNIRQGDFKNLTEDLGFFMYGHPLSRSRTIRAGVEADDDFRLLELPRKELQGIQREVYELLNLAASWSKPINPHSVIQVDPQSHAVKAPLPVHHINVSLQLLSNIIAVKGSSRDCFIFILYRLLTQEPGIVKHITLCSGCGQIFYKIKRQKYCSQRCANRMYMQQYRAKNDSVISESNHKQYEKRTKAKVGNTVKVGRRPRGRDHGRKS
jgi:hypothetical protein